MLCCGEFFDFVFLVIGNILIVLLQGNFGFFYSFVFVCFVLNEIGGFNIVEVLWYGYEDFDLIIWLFLVGVCFIIQYVIVVDYFKYDGSMFSFIENMVRIRVWVWYQYFILVIIDFVNVLFVVM